MGEGRTMQEQLSRATQETKAEDAVADGRGSRAAMDGNLLRVFIWLFLFLSRGTGYSIYWVKYALFLRCFNIIHSL
jgi:hypothetical protein